MGVSELSMPVPFAHSRLLRGAAAQQAALPISGRRRLRQQGSATGCTRWPPPSSSARQGRGSKQQQKWATGRTCWPRASKAHCTYCRMPP